jgi:hypothetical protein
MNPGRHPLARKRTDDEVGLVGGGRGAHHLRAVGALDADRVTGGAQLDPDPLDLLGGLTCGEPRTLPVGALSEAGQEPTSPPHAAGRRT